MAMPPMGGRMLRSWVERPLLNPTAIRRRLSAVEELVGDIWDDTDVIVTECKATGENTYEVSGDMNIDDFFEEVDFVKPEGFTCEYSTMGGWAIEQLEADPHLGDSFRYENLFVIVAQMDEERVTKLTVLVEPTPEDEEEL